MTQTGLPTGRRLTPRRRLVLEALTGTSAHPDAEQLIGMVRRRDPAVSVATVYNTLRLLVDSGRVVELRGLGRRTRFDSNTSDHDHFSCRLCGTVEDVPRQHATPARLTGPGLDRHRVENVSAHLTGVCGRCRG